MRKGLPTLADAVERITLHMATHEMRHPADIGATLRALAESGEAITIYPAGQDFIMARVEAVDVEGGSFVLDLADGARLPSGHAVFVAALGGNAKLQFEMEHEWTGQPGFPNLVTAPFPASCQVLNRRAEPRLESPVGGSYSARFTIFSKVYELPLYDFSGGGVGLRASPEQALDLYVGKKLEGVELELGPSLSINADLEIRLMRPFRTFLLGQQVQVGCRISNITMQMRQSLERAVERAKSRK
jgi:c-di-GMP-binding flagellar brake protein YcgR